MIHNAELKIAVDFALCSVCRHFPDIFTSLLSSATESQPSGFSVLDSKSLMETLGRAAQSEPALEKLVHSGLLDLVSQTMSGKMTFLDCLLRPSVRLIFYQMTN